MTVIHIVLFKLDSSGGEGVVKQICDEMVGLRDQCMHPENNKPYILSSSGGKDNSPEGLQHGLTHGFVVEFASVEDRDYYVSKDPAHLAFVDRNKDRILDVRVIDYEKGVY